MALILKNSYFIKRKNIGYVYNNNKKQIRPGLITVRNKPNLLFNKTEYKNLIKYDKVFLFAGKYDYNWRHFINETFCSLKYMLNQNYKNYKIIIPFNEYNSNRFKHKKEIIEILKLQKKVILIKETDMIFAKQMIIPKRHLDFSFIKLFIKKCIQLSKYPITKNMKNIYLSRSNADKLQPKKIDEIVN